MKFLFDFFPVLAFFIAFKWPSDPEQAIYIATATLIVASILQIIIYWLLYRRFEKMHVITLIVVLIFGAATLLFHDERFIKWKPTVVLWIFALIALATHFIGEKTLFQRMIGLADGNIIAPPHVWARLNISWIVFFILAGAANIYVAFNFSIDTWVDFKVFGLTILNFVFMIGQLAYLFKYIKNPEDLGKEGS